MRQFSSQTHIIQSCWHIILGGKAVDKERGFEFDNSDEILALFDMAIETGMRLSEIYTLEKSQIDFE